MQNISGFFSVCGAALLLCQPSSAVASGEWRAASAMWKHPTTHPSPLHALWAGLLTGPPLPARSGDLRRARACTVHCSWGWDGVSRSIVSIFGNQKRMFQLALVGMCIALYIMFRSRG